MPPSLNVPCQDLTPLFSLFRISYELSVANVAPYALLAPLNSEGQQSVFNWGAMPHGRPQAHSRFF